MGEICTSRQAQDDKVRMRKACWVNWDINVISVYVTFTGFALQILLKERARTQAHTEEVQMKKSIQTQSPYYGNLNCGNDYVLQLIVLRTNRGCNNAPKIQNP